MDKENSEQEGEAGRMLYLLQKEILTFEEACLYLGRSASCMYKMTSKRTIPYYVPSGKLIYFKRKELEEWVLQNRKSSLDEIQAKSQDFILNVSRRTNKPQNE